MQESCKISFDLVITSSPLDSTENIDGAGGNLTCVTKTDSVGDAAREAIAAKFWIPAIRL